MRAKFVFVAALVVGCGEDNVSLADGPPVIRHTAGVRIVENSIPSLGRGAWRLSAEPAITIGAIDSDEDSQLFGVRDAIRIENGSIVLANAGSFQLKYFDSDGQFIVNAGGRGGGPGEFSGESSPHKIWRSDGGAVAAWDYSQARISIFDAGGQFVESHTVTREPGAFPQPVGALGDGRLVVYFEGRTGDDRSNAAVGTVFRDSLRFVWYSVDGSDWGEIGWLPGFERQTHEWSGRRYWGRNPFGNVPAYAVGDRSLYYGAADRYEIASYGPDRTLHGIVRRSEGDRTLNAELIDAYIDNQMNSAPQGRSERNQWRRALEQSRYPDHLPAYRRIQIDRENNLWVQGYTLPGSTEHNWSIFNPEGVWLTDAKTPIDLEVYEIGNDYVLGRWLNEDDVEHVLMYELIKQ